MDINSLAHTKWECKYHIVFAPKYRRQVIYKDIKADVGQILGTLCRRKGIEIIEAECMPDHIHMLFHIFILFLYEPYPQNNSACQLHLPDALLPDKPETYGLH